MHEVIEWAYCHVNQLNRERNRLRICQAVEANFEGSVTLICKFCECKTLLRVDNVVLGEQRVLHWY